MKNSQEVGKKVVEAAECLRRAIAERVRKNNGEVNLHPDSCVHSALTLGDDVVLNHFEKVFEKEDRIFVKYYDDFGDYEDPVENFSIDELLTIYMHI